MVIKAYKYRLYPTNEQKVLLNKHFGACRWLYNWALDKKKSAYEADKTQISIFDLKKQLPIMKACEETKWLSEINAQSLQATLMHLDKAYKKFFETKKGYPKFKSKSNKQSFNCPANKREVNWDTETLSIPYIKNIPIVLSRKFDGKIKTVTISKIPTGKYFASILIECDIELPKKEPIINDTTIGIDLGVTDYVSYNNGIKEHKPNYIKNDIKRLKCLQRRLSCKKKGSNNRKKFAYRIAVIHERVSNKRLDYLHKLSHKLINESQVNTICMESLKVSNMLKNHNLAQTISDAGWGKFKELLKYKAEWKGKNIIEVNIFYPSSKTCSNCKTINKELTLSQTTWQCNVCNSTHDRNHNAAKNIKSEGLRISGEALSVEPVELPTLVGAMKQENN